MVLQTQLDYVNQDQIATNVISLNSANCELWYKLVTEINTLKKFAHTEVLVGSTRYKFGTYTMPIPECLCQKPILFRSQTITKTKNINGDPQTKMAKSVMVTIKFTQGC